MTTPTVSISSHPYFTYIDQADADLYLNASISAAATNWQDAATTADSKARALVSATRWLNGLQWLGVPAASPQDLAWPRSGLSGVDSTTIPDAIADACAELAALLLVTPDLQTSYKDPSLRVLKAGSVDIEYFRGDTVQAQGPVPSVLLPMLAPYLNGSTGVETPLADGTCGEPLTEKPYGYNRGGM